MKQAPDLPSDVISAIQANHKIEAIKLLREERSLGLKEAKHSVEAYMRANPNPMNPIPPQPESNANRLVLIVVVLFAGYLLYQMFN